MSVHIAPPVEDASAGQGATAAADWASAPWFVLPRDRRGFIPGAVGGSNYSLAPWRPP